MSPGLTVLTVLAGGLAAAAGACLRFLADRRWGARGVLLANTVASLLAGFAAALATSTVAAESGTPVPAALAVLGAFLLALGTYSTVAVQGAEEVLAGRPGRCLRVWLVQLGTGIVAAALGFGLGASLLPGA